MELKLITLLLFLNSALAANDNLVESCKKLDNNKPGKISCMEIAKYKAMSLFCDANKGNSYSKYFKAPVFSKLNNLGDGRYQIYIKASHSKGLSEWRDDEYIISTKANDITATCNIASIFYLQDKNPSKHKDYSKIEENKELELELNSCRASLREVQRVVTGQLSPSKPTRSKSKGSQ